MTSGVEVLELVGPASAARVGDAAPDLERMLRDALGDATFTLTGELEKAYARVLVARDAAGAHPGLLSLWLVADELHVLSVAVDPAARRAGVGRALVDAALDIARARACRLALLEVRRDNVPAIRLYRAAGFVATGVRRAYYADGTDAVELALPLVAEAAAAILADRDAALDDLTA